MNIAERTRIRIRFVQKKLLLRLLLFIYSIFFSRYCRPGERRRRHRRRLLSDPVRGEISLGQGFFVVVANRLSSAAKLCAKLNILLLLYYKSEYRTIFNSVTVRA